MAHDEWHLLISRYRKKSFPRNFHHALASSKLRWEIKRTFSIQPYLRPISQRQLILSLLLSADAIIFISFDTPKLSRQVFQLPGSAIDHNISLLCYFPLTNTI